MRICFNSAQSLDADLITGHELAEMDDGTFELRLFVGAGYGLNKVRIPVDRISPEAWRQLSVLGIDPPVEDL